MSATPSRFLSTIEHLEQRIAPAGIVYNYVDVDGDAVTVKISKGTLADVVFTKASSGVGEQLLKIDLGSKPVFQGADITITAHPVAGAGNGKVNIGYIKGLDIDLHNVRVTGDLGRIEAGDANPLSAGLHYLGVDSMRLFPLDPSLAPASTGVYDTTSHIKGPLSLLSVRSDVANAGFSADGFGTVVIGGSLVGSTDPSHPELLDFSGQLYSTKGFGVVIVGGDIKGGAGDSSGSIVAHAGSIGLLAVRGSVIGGSGSEFTGAIFATGKIGTLAIFGDVVGGSGAQSGYIYAKDVVNRLVVFGSIYGGSHDHTGEIFTEQLVKFLYVGGQLVGGSSHGTALTATGYIQALQFANAAVGSVVSGTDDGSGLTNSGAIRAYDNIVRLTVRRDLVGNSTNPVFISGYGQPIESSTDFAIGRLTVGGSVQYAEILAGYDVDPTVDRRGLVTNGDAQIGVVSIKGNFVASSIVAGVKTTDNFFGNADDLSVAGNSSTVLSKIGSVVIGGQAYGTTNSTDLNTYGIAAQQVGSVRIGGFLVPLTPGASNDTFALGKARASGSTSGPTNPDGRDFHVYEVV
jgi:hypothetical protein